MNQEDNTNWEYKSDAGQNEFAATATAPKPTSAGNEPPPASTVSWTASEYIDHPHNPGWYLMLIIGTGAIAAGVYFVTKDYLAGAAIVVIGTAVAISAARKPRQITYEITTSGLRVGEKMYAYNQFKSFGVIREDNLSSVNLQPLKRFMPPISAYFAAEDEQHIVSALGEFLPYQDTKLDFVDRLTRRLRF